MKLPLWLAQPENLLLPRPQPAWWQRALGREVQRGKLERWLSLALPESSQNPGLLWLRRHDGRAKLISIAMGLVVTASIKQGLILGALWLVLVGLWRWGGLDLRRLLRRLGPAALFIGATLLPALWFRPLESISLVLLRALASLTLVAWLFELESWTELVASARRLGLPSLFAAVLDMTYRYLWGFLLRLQEALQGRESRLVGRISYKQKILWLGQMTAWLFRQTGRWAQEISEAMVCRGYEGQVFPARPRAWTSSDTVLISGSTLIGLAVILWDHVW